MIVIGAALLGAIVGGMTARKRNGKPADIAQYAIVYAIAFSLLGLLATLLIHRASV